MDTKPLAKAITTLEGQLTTVANAVLLAGAAIDPSKLPPKWAAIVAGAMNIALIAQRGVVKVKALNVVTPQGIDTAAVGSDVEKYLKEIAAADEAAVVAQNEPGIPPEQIATGLSSTPPVGAQQ